MWYSVSHEALVFAAMTAGGAAAGILFDIMRSLREGFSSGRIFTHITDSLFWLAAGAVTVWLLIRFNDGILRMYEFFGMFLGGFLYFLTLSPLIKKAFTLFFGFLHKIILLIFKMLLTPAVFLYKILLGLFKVLCTFFCKKEEKRWRKKG